MYSAGVEIADPTRVVQYLRDDVSWGSVAFALDDDSIAFPVQSQDVNSATEVRCHLSAQYEHVETDQARVIRDPRLELIFIWQLLPSDRDELAVL
jgi:hypothetical protein